MTGSQTPPTRPSVPRVLLDCSKTAFLELPATIVGGLLFAASCVPLAAAIWFGYAWFAAVALVLPVLSLTALSWYADALAHGRKPYRLLLAGDVVLTITIVGPVVIAAVLLASPGVSFVAGCVLAALMLVTTPFVLSSAVVGDGTVIGSWRLAMTMMVRRPGWAVTILAGNVIAGFVVIATFGVFILIAPVLVSLVWIAAMRSEGAIRVPVVEPR